MTDDINETLSKAKPAKVVELPKAKDKAAAKSKAAAPEQFGDYEIINGAFHQVKPVRDDGMVKIPLCDFVCEIVEEITSDTGLDERALYKIQGKHQSGKPLELVDVPIVKFNAGSWFDAWGSRALVFSGQTKKDNLRVAIMLYSRRNGDIARRHTYAYTGWKKIDGEWQYLTGSGAITGNGLNESLQIDLGGGHMSRYSLPAPPAVEDLRHEAPAIISDLLNICPNRPEIGAALLASVARAPLGECHITDFSILLHGLTGSHKSSIAAIALGFYGDFEFRSLPANFEDSEGAMQVKSFMAKDALFVIDEFKPNIASPIESQKIHTKANKFMQNSGNGAGRGTLNQDRSIRKTEAYNRSLTIITGEDTPKGGQSLFARALVLELNSGDVDIQALSRLQQAAHDGKLTRITAAYLQWMAGRLDKLKRDFPHEVTALRDASINQGIANSHPRAHEILSNLVAGASVFYDFLQDVGAIDLVTMNARMAAIEEALTAAIKTQVVYQSEQDEVERFAALLRSVLSSGNGHIASKREQAPPTTRPHSWGWRKNADNEQRPMGDCLGWYSHDNGKQCELWLDQNTVFAAVQTFAKKQGEPFLMSATTLWRRMYDRNLLLAVEKHPSGAPQTTVKRSVSGVKKRVMVVAAEWIEQPDEQNTEGGYI